MVVFAVCFLLGIPAGLAQRVHLGLQEGLQASLWSLVGAVLAIVTTLIAVSQHASVPWLVAAAVGSTTLAGVANCVALFWRRPELRPRVLAVNSAVIRRLARTGLLFFVLVTASALAYQTDAVVISVLLGTSAVSEYSLPLRLFSRSPNGTFAERNGSGRRSSGQSSSRWPSPFPCARCSSPSVTRSFTCGSAMPSSHRRACGGLWVRGWY